MSSSTAYRKTECCIIICKFIYDKFYVIINFVPKVLIAYKKRSHKFDTKTNWPTNLRSQNQLRTSRCGGGIKHINRSPASRKKRPKGNPVPKGILGQHKYGELALQDRGVPQERVK
jgi:hypothetical protein